MRNSKNTVQGISRQALLRLPNYLNYLKKLQSEGVQTVSAPKIAAALGQNEVQVRKDIAFVSSCAGKPKTGFDTTQLVRDLESFLGYDNVNEAVLVGAGQLGRALLNYKGFAEYGVHIVAAFDHLDVIEWSQSTNTTVGDTVYIYVGEKYKLIMFKCEVVAADQYGNRSTDDYPYYKELAKDPDARYMKLKLVEKYLVGQYHLKELKENGLTSVQGRSKATVQLMKYLNDRK